MVNGPALHQGDGGAVRELAELVQVAAVRLVDHESDAAFLIVLYQVNAHALEMGAVKAFGALDECARCYVHDVRFSYRLCEMSGFFLRLDKITDMDNTTVQNQDQVVIPSFKDWLINMLIAAIPVIGLIMLIVWAVDGNNRNLVRKRWAGASLIINIVIFTLAMLFWFYTFSAMMRSGEMDKLKDAIKVDTSVLRSIDSAQRASGN